MGDAYITRRTSIKYVVNDGGVDTYRGQRVRRDGAAADHALLVHHVGVLARAHTAAAT